MCIKTNIFGSQLYIYIYWSKVQNADTIIFLEREDLNIVGIIDNIYIY